MRPWRFPITLDPGSPEPIYQQVARAIVRDIRRGRLHPGAALPGSRSLAASLGLHRNTILAAYRELLAEGWTRNLGHATRVAEDLPKVAPVSARPGDALGFPVDLEPSRPPYQPVLGLDLGSGLPDPRLLPRELLARAIRRALGHSSLGYGDPAGDSRLRAALATLLGEVRGLGGGPERILITSGSQMALALLARLLIRPGDRVGVEQPGYPPAWATLRAAGATLVPLPVGAEGLDPSDLETGAFRAVYLTPHHQYPTTVTMSASRRLQLLEVARRRGIALLEDDYDYEFHFEGTPVLPLASMDPGGVVVYLGTLSKILAPGVRLGFIAAAPELIRALAGQRWLVDHQGPQFLERAVAELIEDGLLQRHVRKMNRVYAERRDTLARELRIRLGAALTFRPAPGALSFWAATAPELDPETWSQRAQALGVKVSPGRLFDLAGTNLPFLRLGFSRLAPEELRTAVGLLERALPAPRR